MKEAIVFPPSKAEEKVPLKNEEYLELPLASVHNILAILIVLTGCERVLYNTA